MTSATDFLTVSMPLRGKDTNTRPDADTATPTTCCSNSATICRSPTLRSTGRSEATGVTFSTGRSEATGVFARATGVRPAADRRPTLKRTKGRNFFINFSLAWEALLPQLHLSPRSQGCTWKRSFSAKLHFASVVERERAASGTRGRTSDKHDSGNFAPSCCLRPCIGGPPILQTRPRRDPGYW